jgi:hypothetical protein
MAAALGVVAGHEVALHAGDPELKGLLDRRHDPALNPLADRLADRLVLDVVVGAPLEALVEHRYGLAVDLAHEARILAAVALVELDQPAAELGLEDPRQNQDRSVQRASGVGLDRRQSGDQLEQLLGLGERR